MRNVWDGKADDFQAEIMLEVGNSIYEAEAEGFGKNILELEFGSPDWVTLAELRYNAYVFSAFKNHSFMGDLAQLLVDENDQIRNFSDFRALAEGIEGSYYSLWLEAEYETAIATGQMAARWKDFQKDKDIYPYLQYQTVGDDRVREEHRLLDGATYPVDDPFWDSFMPPNGWRCRCDVIQVAGPAVPVTELPELRPGFNHNPGSTLRLASEDHPYFDGLSQEKMDSIRSAMAVFAYRPSRLAKYEAELDPTFWKVLRHQPGLTMRKDIKRSYFDPRDGKVAIGRGKRWESSNYYKSSIIYHEFGHAAHFSRGLVTPYKVDPDLDKAFKACQQAIKGREEQIDQTLRDLYFALQRKPAGWELNGYNVYDWGEMLGIAADTLEALTKAEYGSGHGWRYYNAGIPTADRMEWFAHACSNRFIGNPLFQEIMPEVYDLMITYIRIIE